MSEPFISKIVMFGGNFAPRSWALCEGQLLAVSSNSALFSLLGTIYGGDGRTTFGLPDLRGRTAIHAGNGPGLSSRRLGQKIGAASANLNATNTPPHTHTGTAKLQVHDGVGDQRIPTNNFLSGDASGDQVYHAGPADATMNAASVVPGVSGPSTGGQPLDIHQPNLGIHYIIATYGVYPSRN